ncbi:MULTISPECIES: ubiquinol-cytochrome c reductase iron-sulfur subunit [Bacillus]|uniref:QcrA and Rieske domain-containing protein n=1 Tax=Bacillus TaxID=1386 RepID=UPI000319838F|nr:MULTISPECIES: ubiquinol-cytochrome c reductase iron-sulfur subunit [Bacillus]
MSKQRVSRRQFLNYTLTGVGGFMAAGMIMPMVRFAVDPVLKGGSDGSFVPTKVKESELTEEPQKVSFTVEQKDGWYDSEETRIAWVFKDDKGEIVALSPICKHLGCVVDWNTDKNNPNRFFCNCHFGLYEKNGKNVPNTPPLGPLDVYEVKVKDGILNLGTIKPNPVKGA